MWLRILSCLVLGGSALNAAGPGAKNDFGGRRVLVIGVDGLRADAFENANVPNFRGLMKAGVVSFTAQSGGELGGVTEQPTISGPGWTTIMTGCYSNRHGVTGNTGTPHGQTGGYQPTTAPVFFTRLKEAYPKAEVSVISSWGWIADYLLKPNAEKFGVLEKGVGKTYPERDADVLAKTLESLRTRDPDVLFVHFDQVDGAGHATGFSPENPVYRSAVEKVDQHVGEVLAAVRKRKEAVRENWLVIVVTDHGGNGRSHGGQSEEERNTPMIVSGGGVPKGRVDLSSPGLHVVAATTFHHLGVKVNPAWGWEPGSFGFGPQVEMKVANRAVEFQWVCPENAKALRGIEVLCDGQRVKELPASAQGYRHEPPNDGEPHGYRLVFVGLNEVRNLTVRVPRPVDVTSDLVLHLPFEGNVQDKSGREHHGVSATAVYAEDGRFGKALVLDGVSAVDLGQPEDLKFGEAVDFTVSFWIKASVPWSKDPSILSNKAWKSGANPGWIVAGSAGSLSWQWNLTGKGQARLDFDPPAARASLDDGAWHLVTVSHRRTRNATFYQDGRMIGSRSIRGAGDIDTGFPIRIGRDGSNEMPFDQPVKVDDLRIWRRALSAQDVAVLYGEK